MSWDGPERRKRITNDSGRFRRRGDLKEAWGRIEGTEFDVEALHVLVTGLIDAVGRVDEKADLIKELCTNIDGKTVPPVSRTERVLTLAIPLAIAVFTVVGSVAVAWISLKGQLAQVGVGK